jgi:hypothetical protein
MMGMDDVRPRQCREQTWRDRMGRMTPQPTHGAQRASTQTRRLVLQARLATETDQLAFDVSGQSARQLERVALAAAE